MGDDDAIFLDQIFYFLSPRSERVWRSQCLISTLCNVEVHEQTMNCTDDEEGFQRCHIAKEILSLPARHVLSLPKVKDPLSLRLNMMGALKNWKDVASLLGYTPEKILGLFAHDARPGLILLKDWIYNNNGILGRLVDVFIELKLYSCLEVIHECVTEYEKTSLVNINKPKEDDDNLDANFQGKYKHDTDTCLSSESSMTGSCTISTETESSMLSENATTSSLPPSVQQTDGAGFSSKVGDLSSVEADCSRESEGKSLSCDDLGNGNNEHGDRTLHKPDLFRYKSWSPSGTGCVVEQSNHLQPVDGGRNVFTRSTSHPNDTKSKVGMENKKKSVRKRIGRFFKPKQHKKTPVQSSDKMDSGSPVITAAVSSLDTSTTTFTVTDSYSEPAEKPHDNLSPLKVDEARRLSLTDSLSSGESISSPTSPGYESGYMSSEGPSVSSGKSISIIHCSDFKEEFFQKGVLKLYSRFETLGYKCYLDKLEMLKIAENKFRYAVGRVQLSDFLFICVSPELKRIFDSSLEEISDQLEDDGNCMLRLVSDLILNDLANHGSNRNGKFMTILLEGSSKSDVPCFLESFMKYRWPKDERKIRCIIENLPEIIPAPVSGVKTDPPSQVVRPAGLI